MISANISLMLVNFLIYTIFSEPTNELILFYYGLSMLSIQLIIFLTIVISAIGCLILSLIGKNKAESIEWEENTSYTKAFFYFPYFLMKSWEKEGRKSITGWCILSGIIAVFVFSAGSFLTIFLYFLMSGMIYTLWSARKNKKESYLD